MEKNKKYDTIIYSCLFGAVIFILIGSIDYIKDFEKEDISYSNKESTSETNPNETKTKDPTVEPERLKEADKNIIIKRYIDSVVDGIYYDDLFTPEMIQTWGEYEVLNATYEKEITEDYYSYFVDLKISNPKATIPINKNEELSTNEYIVISIKANILDSTVSKGFVVKNLDPLTEN